MANIVVFVLNGLSIVWSDLISDPIKSIGAFASIGTLIISWKNFKKDNTRLNLIVKRAQNAPLILQHPSEEFLSFEIYNQGILPVVINEIGITVTRRPWSKTKFINLVDLPHASLEISGTDAIGTLEYTVLPGSLPAKSLGVFLLNYSKMKAASLNYQNSRISSESLDFFGSERLIKTCQQFQKLQDNQGKNLQIIPYVITGSGERFISRKSCVKLGSLGDAVV
ncbi:MAG: hypothetical protein H0X31_14210 [Nostocaceae cyanobacterium]|nr:hypothetical protein [Nostocaceae cyanobacterium]